jgi:hypothetical protein
MVMLFKIGQNQKNCSLVAQLNDPWQGILSN